MKNHFLLTIIAWGSHTFTTKRQLHFRPKTRILSCFLIILFLGLHIYSSDAQTRKRALWVTRWDFNNEDDVRKIMENARFLGAREILFQTRGNATVFYPSKIEPWAWELTGDSPKTIGQDPGWDPLKTALEEAQKHDVELHAWINVFPGWRGVVPAPPGTKHPWVNHKSWFMVDHRGLLMQPKKNWYTFMSPGIPAVREHIASVCGEIAKLYPALRGVHLDYVRYPAHRETGSFRDFSYDRTSVNAFKKLYGTLPRYDKKEWQEFKQAQVSASIEAIRKSIQSASPSMELSATFVAEINKATSEVGQNPRHWFAQNLLDWAVPMMYKRNISSFQKNIEQLHSYFSAEQLKKMVFGINVDFNSTRTIQNQMSLSLKEPNAGEVLFAYSSLFPHHAPNAKALDIQKIWREVRLRELLLSE